MTRASMAAMVAAAGSASQVLASQGYGTGPVRDATPTFTVVGLPDTQNYSEFYPEIYHRQTSWIAEQRRARNIRFVSHYGDVVNHADRLNEWAVAKSAMRTLDRINIPYGVAAGNHDVHASGGAGEPYIPQNYLDNFGPQNFQGRSWYGGASPSGMSNYQTFSGGGKDFLAFHLTVDTPVDELVWAQGVINRNPDKAVMVTTHRYLQDSSDYTGGFPVDTSGRYPDIWYTVEGVYSPGGVHAEEFFQNFVRTNSQIFLVNCGHFHEEYRQTSTNLAGLPVHEVLADYQDDPNGGNGFLRMMEFDTGNDRISVRSYSPTLDRFNTADESQFTLGVDFERYASAVPRATFTQGINGYSGTQDTWLNQDQPRTGYGSSDRIVVDDDTTNSPFSDKRGQGLVRFDGIFTSTGEERKIPLGATIVSAQLRVAVPDDIDTPFANPDVYLYEMARAWSESSTWDSMVDGLNVGSDYSVLLAVMAGDNDPDGDYWRVLNVTSAVQRWANGSANFGFAFIPQIISGNDDGIEMWSSEYWNALLRPTLIVDWRMGTVPAPSAGVLLALGLAGAARRRRR